MARFVAGEIVVGEFPFSGNPATSKRRPAVVLASCSYTVGQANFEDYLLCAISSRNVPDGHSFELLPSEIENGSLKQRSFVRPLYLFGADASIIVYKIGNASPAAFTRICTAVKNLMP